MMQQGTLEWKQARLGMITASRFADVMTMPRTKRDREAGKLSQTAESYLYELLGEYFTRIPVELPSFKAIQWGKDHEDEARLCYEAFRGVSVQQVGFVSIPGLRIGCSPDGLVGDDGGIELKCPYTTREHMRTTDTNTVPTEYEWQVQGNMLVTDRQWWDYVSFDPRFTDEESIDMALHVIRVERDEGRIEELREALLSFECKLNEKIERRLT